MRCRHSGFTTRALVSYARAVFANIIINANRPHGVSRHHTDRVYVQVAVMPLQQHFTAIHREKKNESATYRKKVNAQWDEVLLRSVVSLLKFHEGHLTSLVPAQTEPQKHV